MTNGSLRDCRIVVIEDEYLLADDISAGLAEAGAWVLGPAGTLEGAMALINAESRIDGAILDVNLSGVMAYPVADLLMARGVPFMFTSGYDRDALPPRFHAATCCEKPFSLATVTLAIGRLIHR